MAEALSTLGQSNPKATTDTDLFTVAASTQVAVSLISACNQSSSVAATFRVAVVPTGDTLAAKHYVYFDVDLDPRASFTEKVGWGMQAGDKVVVRASSANVSFGAWGSKVT
jgi:hypothetical protein